MNRLVLFLILAVGISPGILGQQTDDNTLAINQYFQLTNDKQIEKNPTLQEQDAQSNVNVIQTGFENEIYINSLQNGDNQKVNQAGSKNNYEYYNYYSRENSSMQVNQEGVLNSIQVFGENSLMKDAIINQKSDFKSIVVKNYTN